MFQLCLRDLSHSTHPVWVDPDLNNLRMDFLNYLGIAKTNLSHPTALNKVIEIGKALSAALAERAK